jgi:hypothetical protein
MNNYLKSLLFGLGCGTLVLFISVILSGFVDSGENSYLIVNFGLGFLSGILIEICSLLKALITTSKKEE